MDRDLEKPNNTSILMDESHQKLLEMINTFRTNPKSFIEYKKSLKKKNHPEYEEFLNALEPKNELQPDEELTNIAKEEVKKFSENSEYSNYQIGEEFQHEISDRFIKDEKALIAIEDVNNESFIPKIIVNEIDEEKKGRNILTSNDYTHIGLNKIDVDDGTYMTLVFSKIDEEKLRLEQEALKAKKEYEPTEEEKPIFDILNGFRTNPRDFFDKKKGLKKKNFKEYESYINTLSPMNELKLNEELINLSKEEVKKFSEDSNYNRYQTGEEFNHELSQNFMKEKSALIGVEDIDNESIIPKIISNEIDAEKKGREILTNNEYTHIGFNKLDTEDGSYLVIIFSKMNEPKKEREHIIQNVKKEYIPTEEEKPIFDILNDFRSEPKKYIGKKKLIKKKGIKDYENYLNSLDKMNLLQIDEELINICKEEVKKFSEDADYNKYQIGEELEFELNNKFDKEHSALIALEDFDNDSLIPKIIVNDSDKDKKGREILTNNIYTHIGFNKIENEEGTFMVILFSSEKGKTSNQVEKVPEKIKESKPEKDKKEANPPQIESNNINKSKVKAPREINTNLPNQKIISNIDPNESVQEERGKIKKVDSTNINSSTTITNKTDAEIKVPKDNSLSSKSKIQTNSKINEVPKTNNNTGTTKIQGIGKTPTVPNKDINNNINNNTVETRAQNNFVNQSNNMNNLDILPNKMQDILNTRKEIYFFISLKSTKKYSVYVYKASRYTNKLISTNFELISNYESNHTLYYFRIIPEEEFQYTIYFYEGRNNYFYTNYYYTNNIFPGHLQILSGNQCYVPQQLKFNDEGVILETYKTIDLFSGNKLNKTKLIENYRPKGKIDFQKFIKILEICVESNSFPLFLSDFKYQNYNFDGEGKLNDYSMFKKLSEIIKNTNKGNEIQNLCYNNLSEIYGRLIYKYNKKEFIDLINLGDNLAITSLAKLIIIGKIALDDFVKKNKIKKEKIFTIIIEKANYLSELQDIFLKTDNINESLKLINMYYDSIIKNIQEKKKMQYRIVTWMKSGNNPLKLNPPKDNDNLVEMKELLSIYLKKEANNKSGIQIFDIKELINSLNNFYEKNWNLNNLIKVKDIIRLIDDINKDIDISDIQKSNNESIHDVGIYLSLKNYNNEEILEFIQNDIFYNDDAYEESPKRNPKVFDKFNIHDEKKTGFNKFKDLKIWEKFTEKYQKQLFQIFIDKITCLNDLNILFNLFNKDKLETEFINILIKKIDSIKDNNYVNDDNYLNNLYENFFIIFSNMINKKIKIKTFTKVIEYHFDQVTTRNIYIYVLKKNDEKVTKGVSEEFSRFFIENLKNIKKANEVYLTIKACSKNKGFLKKIFNEIGNEFVIDEDDFFTQNKTPNFELYELFSTNGYDTDENYYDTTYFETVGKVTNSIYFKIKALNVSFIKINEFLENNKEGFRSRLAMIYKHEQDQIENKFNSICKEIEKCKGIFSKLDKIYDYLNTFEPRGNNQIITTLNNLLNRLRGKNISDIENENLTESLYNYDDLVKKSQNIKFKESYFFMKLYDEIKKEKELRCNDIQLLKETINLYQTSMKKVINYRNENFLKIPHIDILLQLFQNKRKEKEINSELELMSKEFKNDIDKLNNELDEDQKVTIEAIKSNINNFAYYKKIKDYLESYKFLITLFKELSNKQDYQETELTESLIQKVNEFSSENIKSEDVEKGKQLLLKNGIDIEKDNEDPFNQFLLKIIGKKDEIKFCVGKTDEEIKNLNEFLQDRQSEVGSLQPEDFDDFIGSKKYVNEVIQSNFVNDKELVNNLKEFFKRDKLFIIKFNNYLEKYGEIKELYEDSLANKSEITKSIIQKLMERSNISIKKDGNTLKFVGEYGEKNDKFDLKLLLELKNKALFSQNTIKEDEKYKEQITKFNDIVKKLHNLSETVNNLILSGYPFDIKIQLKIQADELKNDDTERKTAKEIIKKYEDLSALFEKEIVKAYQNKPLIRFLYGPLFLSVLEHIKKNKEILFLLKAISNGKISEIPPYGQFQITDGADFSEIFNTISDYLDECLLINRLNVKKILESNRLIKKKVGLYRIAVFQNIEKNLLTLYRQLTGNYPLTNTVLICNEYTSYEEIKAFLYLSFKSDQPVLFCLLGIEKLDYEKRIKSIKLISKFHNVYGAEMRACLVILYMKDSDMKGPLSKIIPDNRMISLDENEEGEAKLDMNNIEIYTSERAGFGKTEEIRTKIKEENRNYIYFPIGGVFTRKEVIKRLIESGIPQNNVKNYVIHFDLNETNLTELVQEILLKILILKKLDINEQIFYFGNELNLKIELPNAFDNYMEKFPLLKLFKNTSLTALKPLKIPPNIEKIGDDDIQIVANTLKSFKDGSIGHKNIDFESTSLLDNNTCQNLIDEYIKNKENDYNYYQKINFIKLLSIEFTMLKDSFVLDPQNFQNNIQKNTISESRKQIVQSILDSSVFFTKGPYDKLIQSQKLSQKNYDVYDEEKLNQQALESLEQIKDNVTFDSVPATLFFFNADKCSFTAITKQPKGSAEYSKFYNLINTQSMLGGEKKDLTNYANQNHLFYLNELKNILGLPEMLLDEQEILELNKKIREETKEELDPSIYALRGVNLNPETEDEKKAYKEAILNDRKLYMAKLAKINGNYVYTRDNFIKSVIILLKIQASIPVILMGETGCGKTSLLKMLSIFMNKGSEKMKTLNIHAGTDEQDIITFMTDKVINKLEEEYEEDLKKIMDKFDKDPVGDRMKYQESQEKELKKKKVWVFFDELNTCNSMGLIAEIMCKRTMHGKKLPDNLVFLGAVNPYRTMTTKMKQSGLTYYSDNNDKARLLVYTVNPMPHTLMNYIFNFSSLGEKEEREYIKSMISQNITKYYENKEEDECKNLIDKVLGSICECHNFIRKEYDESSVSLREIRRFNIFFKFFSDYLKNKSKYKSNYSTNYQLLLSTLNMTIYLCYYLRISDKKIREDLATLLNKYFDGNLFLQIPNREVTYIAEQFIIDVEKGIALNSSLKENLFTSFICIVNRIPLIIVGKPGEGKSLTIQTINQTMKGIYSKSPLFQEYPQLFMYNYQGSETSTSQGIIETFDKARKYAQNQLKRGNQEQGERKEKFIAMIFFDEMGLAERSPNNPLKAIHSQLEYDDNEFKIAFVGISNWKIDASKMNRCLTLSKPDPDKEDLVHTADIIAKALDNTLANNYKSLIEALAISYYEYKQTVSKDKLIENFHGNRDFYHLIKCAMRELIKVRENINEVNKDKILTKIGLMSLTRNFGGLSNSLEIIKGKFKNTFTNYNEEELSNYNILECIKDNLNDYNSRFLMLVANSTIIKYLENVLNSQGKDYVFLTGSQFQNDKKAASKGGGYSEDLLNKIQYQMSKECVLILKNLEVIYPSLYELFNQNYIKIGNKYFSKIAFASSKSSSEVHSNFRVILLITQEKLNKMKVDPPLLNRFEKQIVSFKDSLNEKQIKLSENLSKSLEKIKSFNGKKNLVYNLPELLINCNENEIEGLIYKISNNNKEQADNNDFIEEKIYEILVPTFCQDIIASVKYSGFANGKNAKTAKKILEIYKKKDINNFQQFLQKSKKCKNIIYTFSNMLELLFPEDTNIRAKETYVNTILSENKVTEILTKFFEEKMDYLIFRFEEKDLNKMNHLSYLVSNFEMKYKQQNEQRVNNDEVDEEGNMIINTNTQPENKQKIIFLVHLVRKQNKTRTISLMEELVSNLDETFDKYFIDNLKSKRNDFSKILDIKSPTELVKTIIDFDKFLDKNMNKIISYFDYNFQNKFSSIDLKEYTDKILKKLIFEKQNPLVKFLREKLVEITLKNMNQNNIIPNVYTSKVFQNTDIDFFEVLATYMLSDLSNKLLSVVNIIEKNGFFQCLLVKDNNDEITKSEIIMNQMKEVFDNMDILATNMPKPQLRFNKIDIYGGFSIPSSHLWFNKIKIDFIVKEKIGEKYIKNENTIRPRAQLKDDNLAIEKYKKDKQKLNDSMKEEFYKNDCIRNIFSSDNKNIIKSLVNDYLNLYCIEVSDKFSNKADVPTNPIQFIELLLQLKFNILSGANYQENEISIKDTYFESKENFTIENLSELFLFLESYKNEIIYLTEAFCLLNSNIKSTLAKIKEIIASKRIVSETTNRNPYYKKIVNEVFFILMESLLKSIYKNKEEICELEIYTFYPFFDILKFIEASFNKINQKFLLFSNELYSLRNLLAVYTIFKDEQDIKEIIKEVLEIIGKDNEDLQSENFEALKENIIGIKKIISKRFGEDSDKLADYMSNLLRQQYRKIDNPDYKFELLNLAFENDKLIIRSLFFIDQTIKVIYPNLVKRSNNKIVPRTKEECEAEFLSFISTKKSDRVFVFYEKKENKILEQVILYYFELLTYNYFENLINKYKNDRPDKNNPNIRSQKECDALLLNQNLLYLNKALIHIDRIYSKNDLEEGNLNNLGKIYAVAFVKLYIKYLADIYKYNRDKINFIDISRIISGSELSTRKVIKIFFFKNFLQYFENYAQFDDFIKKDNEFPFKKEYLDMNQTTKITYILNEHLLTINDFEEKYLNNLNIFVGLKNNNFDNLKKMLNPEFIQNIGFDVFYCLCINHLLIYYFSNEKEDAMKKIGKLKDGFNKLMSENKLGFSESFINLVKKLFNFQEFINTLNAKQGNTNNFTQEQFEIIAYSLRFVLQSGLFNNNNFYYNLLTSECKNYISNNYIIGDLAFNNVRLKSYYALDMMLRIPMPQPTGFYVCTCGQYFTLGNCTCPNGIFNCPNPKCKLKISGTGHKLLGPEAGQTDQWRIILKEEDKNVTSWSQREIAAGKIPCLLFDEYKKRYVDKDLNNQPKGILKQDPADFIERKENVRTLDELSFRILNFILYSHLFITNILGNLSDQELSEYTHGEFTCLRIIEKNWELIEEILNKKGINNIKIFMNIIFEKIIELMKGVEDMSTMEKREEFETNVKNLLEQIINNKEGYEQQQVIYNNSNEKVKGSDTQSLVEILAENYSPFEDLYSKEDYPNLEMFLISKYPNIHELERNLGMQPDYTITYCLLNQVLISQEEYGLVENVVHINKLVDLLYKKFNNKIERDKAKNKKLLECFDENDNIDEIKENIIEPYIKAWNKIKSKCTKYLCRPDMKPLEITSNHTLIYFLPDDGELNYGMYLASAYKNFIEWQNSFIKTIINSIGPQSLLRSYLSQLNQEIYVQDAGDEDVVKINEDCIKIVKDMINQYSMRDIFRNGKIDHKEYKRSIKYDFNSIEAELGRKILPGLKLFVSQEANEPIKFVSYLYETFRSNRSSIITNYNTKYPARDLVVEEEKLLYQFINENKKRQNFSKEILSSCQILIDYIQKENYNKNLQIYTVIKDLPQYIEIDESLKSFFTENKKENLKDVEGGKMFSINTLINIYNLVEFLCWEQFKENLNDQYKMKLSDENKKAIKKYFEEKINKDSLVKKIDVAVAVRRLISRYLSGRRLDTDISEFKTLFSFIARADLWRTDLPDNEGFDTAIYTIFDDIKKSLNLIIECNELDNICDSCSERKREGEKNPCANCENCNSGLRIGHALSFYQLISEENYDPDKYNQKKKKELEETIHRTDSVIMSQIPIINRNEEEEEEINTNTNQVNIQHNIPDEEEHPDEVPAEEENIDEALMEDIDVGDI